jgi:DNA-binding SARP family transcriptional activator/Flp pilus assembly protein TadD
MFIVKLLGGLSIESTAGALPPGAQQRRRLSLLAILALGGARGVSRERIQTYLWPESSAERARHALDQLVYTTRRELGADSIVSSTTDLRLDSAIVRADIWAFDDAIHAERWEEAVQLYAGPLLHGARLGDCVDLERWIDAEHARRAQDHLRALDTLASAATRRGDVVEAVRWRRRHAAADPFSAAVALDLMRALEAAGDRAGAVQHARAYQQIVRTNLEIEPDAQVTTLADAIAARAALARAVAPTATSDETTVVPADWEDGHPAAQVEWSPAVRPALRVRREWRGRRMAGAVAVVTTLGALAVTLAAANRTRWVLPSPVVSVAGRADTLAGSQSRTDAGTSRLRQTADAEARSLYLRARAAWEKRTKEPLEEAVVLYRQAAERDPSFAAAYAGLAQSYAMLGYFGFAPGAAMFPKARAAAVRAIELDPNAGDAYAALGQALAWQHAWSEAEEAYKRAIDLSPDDATAHQWYALLLAYLGRAREAAAHTGHASQLDPLSVQVNNMHGMMLYYAGDLGAAVQQYERTVDAEPDSAWVRRNPWVLTNFSRIAAAAGRHAQAVALVERALAVVPSHPRPLFDLVYAYAAAGKPDSARLAFARADTAHAHYAVYRALTHALLGERDEAFAWFDRAGEWPLPSLVTLSCERRLAALRSDPRFETVRARLSMSSH